MAFNLLLILIITFLGPLFAEEDPLSEYVHVPARYIAPIPANSILKDNTSPDRMSVNLCAAKCTLLFRNGNFPCYAFEYTPGSNMCIYTNITTLMLNAGYLSLKQNKAVHYYERPKGSFKNLFHGQPNTALKDQGSYFDIKRNVTVEQCAHMCLLSTQTGCLSFSYSNQLTACGLSNKYHSNNAKTSAPIMATPLYDHYQFFTSWPCNAIIPMNYTPTAIASVRFPYQAVRNIQCYLKLEAPPGHRIEMTFSTVYFGKDVCTYSGDGITLHDGETVSAPVIGRFCERTGSALKVRKSTANSLFVTYKTGSVPMAFKAVYQFVNPCEDHTCQNGAICSVTNRSYVCNCPHGWSGRFCEANIDDCVNEPCLFGGTCVDELNGYHCQCSKEFSGNRCEKFLGKCAEHPCVHGACHVTSRYNYTCKCEKDYIGKNCDHKQQYCNPNPCVHGSCLETFGYYLCQCKNGYTGQNCNIPENPCKYRPCANGVCSLVNATYHCACSKGFYGRNCDIIDKCANMNCLHGKCVNMNNTLKCECDNGFTGSNCDVMINQCAKVNCFHGKCINTNNTLSCECKEGWTGSTCETDIAIDPCDKAQCGIGLCEALHGSRMEYRCLCPNGYHGKNCQSRGVTNVDKLHTKSRPCEEVQCLNGGKCKNLNGKAICSCKAPFSGNFCERKLKDCSFLPCLANATCVDTRLGHVCICPTGIVGQACDRVMSPCISNPCKTSICQESNNTYGYRCVLYTMTGHNNVTITSVIIPPNNSKYHIYM
ncbi:uncharacterized protein LOC143051139 [Mytilus galloprovincialis]|uniref:uncharacterized protein LOC143051139 n=1 Tax=Mytilus galloprovincialis TaxID=29158 RepID=UPI003F7BB0FB